MDSFVNRKVTSKHFGEGIIKQQGPTHLSVFFYGDRTREMEYPACFKNKIIELLPDEAHPDDDYQTILEREDILPEPCHGKANTVQHFDTIDSFVNFFNEALDAEKRVLQQKGGRRQRLMDGKVICESNGLFLYSFESEAELNVPDDTPITIWFRGEPSSATLHSIVDFTVVIAIHEYWGKEIESIEISAEPWQLLEKLMEHLTELNNYPSSIVLDLVCNGPDHCTNTNGIMRGSDNAVPRSITEKITFVWGPPGTGKTETLAKIALTHIEQGHRVLMVSYSNVSVDGATLRVKKLDSSFVPGRLLRYGYPRDKQLLADEELNSFNLVLGKFPHLKKENQRLQEERKNVSRSSKRFAEINERLKEIHDELKDHEKQLVHGAQFVSTTISKVVIDELLYGSTFDVVLFDEASMAYIPQIVFAASLARRHFICLGDFNQLPPIAQSNEPGLEWDIFQYCGITQAINSQKGHDWLCLLDTQFRMHPQIAEFSSVGMYQRMIKSAPKMKEDRETIVSSAPCKDKPTFLVDLSGMMTVCRQTPDGSRMNLLSALITFGFALEASARHDVGIITPYSAQAKLYNAMARDAASAFPDRKTIFGATVHAFQGSERDVILYDTVDCYRQQYAGVLLTSQENNCANRLFNVAITRSKGKFITFANVDYFKQKHLSNKLLLAQFLYKYKRAGKYLNGSKIISEYSEEIGEMFTYYPEVPDFMEFEICLNNAHDEIRMDIPEGFFVDKHLQRIVTLLVQAEKRGVSLFIRAANPNKLPSELQKRATLNEYAWNPVTIIDRHHVWYGMPLSKAEFYSETRTIPSKYHPIIHYIGSFGALSVLNLLVMTKNNDVRALNSEDSDIIREFIERRHNCSECGHPMILKKARSGKCFLSCSQYPKCKSTLEIEKSEIERCILVNHIRCSICHGSLSVQNKRKGSFFLQCSNDMEHRFSIMG